jgi:hypothetical protein
VNTTINSEVDSRDSIVILFNAAENDASRDISYGFVKRNWAELIERLPREYAAFLPQVASNYCDREHRMDVKAFFDGRSTGLPRGTQILQQVLDGIDRCIVTKEYERADLERFFTQYGNRPPQQ